MIVVTVELLPGGNASKAQTLGTVVIDNQAVSADKKRGNYRVRTFKKGENPLIALRSGVKPTRQGMVIDYPRLSNPIWSLVARALAGLGYK